MERYGAYYGAGRTLPPIYPIAANGVVFVDYPLYSIKGAPRLSYTDEITALRARDGAQLWSVPDSNGIVDFMVIGNGILVVFDSSEVVGLRITDGATVWRDTNNTASYRLTSQGDLPVVSDNGAMLYFAGGNEIYAMRIADGLVLWRTAVNYNTPLMEPLLDGNTLYIGSFTFVIAVRADTGAILWTSFLNPYYPATYRPVAVIAGTLYVAEGRFNFGLSGDVKVNPATGESEGTEQDSYEGYVFYQDGVWYDGVATPNGQPTPTTTTYSLYSLNVAGGRLLWHVTLPTTEQLGFEAQDKDVLYIGAPDLYAMRLSDGALLWSRQLADDSFDVRAWGAGYMFETADGFYSYCYPNRNVQPQIRALSSANGNLAWIRTLIAIR